MAFVDTHKSSLNDYYFLIETCNNFFGSKQLNVIILRIELWLSNSLLTVVEFQGDRI